MTVECLSYLNSKGKFLIEIDLSGLSMYEAEHKIQEKVNELGNEITKKCLSDFDADGSPIVAGNVKFTSKGQYNGKYETPYGQIITKRHIYQTYKGGKTYCPLNEAARIIKNTCTPKLAKMIANKYASLASSEVIQDMQENHSRKLVRSYIQNISDFVGAIVDAKEEVWTYDIQKLNDPVSTVAVSMDGANILILKDGYREAMTGAISLYNKNGDRLHSMYIAVEPEYGKEKFFRRMEKAIQNIKLKYPLAFYLGVSDGAKDLWAFLKKHTTEQILDYYHASEYLAGAAYAISPTNGIERKKWLDNAYTNLKHDVNYIPNVLKEMKTIDQSHLASINKERLKSAITYFTNNKSRMKYAENTEKNLPIGSGVIEAACKTIVKTRLCRVGMKWKNPGAKIVLSLRAMIKTKNKWNVFWNKINLVGVPKV